MFKERLLKEALKRYAGEHVLKHVLTSGYDALRLGGEPDEVTVYFQDIAPFTSMAYGVSADELAALLNEYLEAMTQSISRYEGIVDKYLGNAIQAFWKGSQHAIKASVCALECVQIAARLSQKWSHKGVPEMQIRIGMDSGTVLVGNFGSTFRCDYTIMGKTVNVASRIERANESYGTHILLSQVTQHLLGERFCVRQVDRLGVKGQAEALDLYELVGTVEHVTGDSQQFVTVYNEGIGYYAHQEFQPAAKCFQQALSLHPQDRPSQQYLSRCEHYLNNPPGEDWDGILHVSVSQEGLGK